MQNYEYLGKPLQIGRLTIRNRFCMAPIGGGQHHLPGGGLKDETIQYLVERAKGGFGLIFTGAIAADGTDWRRADCREQVTEWLKGL